MNSEPTLALHDTADANCRELLDVFCAQGVETIVLSPGSRNTPILIAASARPGLRKLIIDDERTAAFIALGIGIVTRRPVAIACTSGTALYNYSPAVAEAYYQNIPLIVITADRPAQWIDQDDSQTLRQPGTLDNIVKQSFDIYPETGITAPCANSAFASEREWHVNRIANEAVLTATGGRPGPVHINMQFGNPLNMTIPFRPGQPRLIRVISPDSSLPPETASELAEYLMEKRIMVTAGFMAPDHKLNRAIAAFARLGNVTVLAETLSNLHLDDHSYMVDSLLCRMDDSELDRLRPDVIISIGGALVSRKLKEYLRGCEGTEQWTLGDTALGVDCLQRLSTHVETSPRRFFSNIGSMIRHLMTKGQNITHNNYRDIWQAARERAYARNIRITAEAGWSELKALSHLFVGMPTDFNLFVSNGTCVRYAQLLIDRLPHSCYCNRGVSGIDGTNATALGVAVASRRPTLLVTGDMSFAYCPEILGLRRLGGDLRIVVVNNSGGGIFRFIRTTRDLDIREKYFCADPQVPIAGLAAAYGWNHIAVENEQELMGVLDTLWGTPDTIVEIKVDPQSSANTLINFGI